MIGPIKNWNSKQYGNNIVCLLLYKECKIDRKYLPSNIVGAYVIFWPQTNTRYHHHNAQSKKCSTKVVDPCDELFVLRMEIRDGSKPVLAYGFFFNWKSFIWIFPGINQGLK